MKSTFCQQWAQSCGGSWHCAPCYIPTFKRGFCFLRFSCHREKNIKVKERGGCGGESTYRLSFWEGDVSCFLAFWYLCGHAAVTAASQLGTCPVLGLMAGDICVPTCSMCFAVQMISQGREVEPESFTAFLLQARRDRNGNRRWERAIRRDQGAAAFASGESNHTF